ncbi:XRE family transcriptional regulator [Streptacidiphilus sp. 4-A2]|nr:XRE family transcriptional regulator [Streptacidiphilus sp. 4-A2]
MSRRELKIMLERHRGLIDPTERGFEPTPVRRGRPVAGLSQPQMDVLLMREFAAGTYGRLERGQIEHPPTQLLDEVSRQLGLNEDERTMLYLLANGEKPTHPLDPRQAVELKPTWQLALDGMSHMAYITDAAWNTLAWNESFPHMFPDDVPGVEPGQPPRNIMWWMALCEAARTRYFPYWDIYWGPLALAQLKAALLAHPDNEDLRDLEAQALADPVTRPIYTHPELEYVHPDSDTRPLYHAELGPGMVTMCAAEPFSLPGGRLMIIPFVPGAVTPPTSLWPQPRPSRRRPRPEAPDPAARPQC